MPDTPEVSVVPPKESNPESTPVYQNPQTNENKLNKLLVMLKLKSAPKPIVEVKPGVAPESEGRVKINREELQKKLQQEPSAS